MEEFITTQLTRFDATIKEEDLKALAIHYAGLTIGGVDDKVGYKAVYDARIALKKKRVEIAKIGKDLRSSANAFNKAVIDREDQLIDIIAPVEKTLQQMEDAVDEEKERIRIEKENAETERIQALVDALRKFGVEIDWIEAKGMTTEQFDTRMDEAQHAWEERQRQEAKEKEEQEAKRKQEEEEAKKQEEANRVERERLDKIREEQERKEQEFRAEKAKFEGERREHEEAIRKQEAERKRLEDLEVAKKEAAEKALKDKEIADRMAEEERIEKLNEGPDKDRFGSIAQDLGQLIDSPIWDSFKTKVGQKTSVEVRELVKKAFQLCHTRLKK